MFPRRRRTAEHVGTRSQRDGSTSHRTTNEPSKRRFPITSCLHRQVLCSKVSGGRGCGDSICLCRCMFCRCVCLYLLSIRREYDRNNGEVYRGRKGSEWGRKGRKGRGWKEKREVWRLLGTHVLCLLFVFCGVALWDRLHHISDPLHEESVSSPAQPPSPPNPPLFPPLAGPSRTNGPTEEKINIVTSRSKDCLPFLSIGKLLAACFGGSNDSADTSPRPWPASAIFFIPAFPPLRLRLAALSAPATTPAGGLQRALIPSQNTHGEGAKNCIVDECQRCGGIWRGGGGAGGGGGSDR